jgi:hypothetical protein
MPYRRAVAATWRGARKLSSTILSFSSSDQRLSPACLHYFKPFDLSTALMTVHKDSSHNQNSSCKATGRRETQHDKAVVVVG